MTSTISPANALVTAPSSATPIAAQGETFRDIFSDSTPQSSPMADLPAVDVATSFFGLAKAVPDIANPALAPEDKSDATSDEPTGDGNVLMTQFTQVAPTVSVAQVIAAAAKAVGPQPQTAAQTDDDASQPTGRAAAALTSGRTKQGQWFSKLSHNVARDAPLAAKTQTPPAQVPEDVPMPDATPDIATAATPVSVSTSQPTHSPATAPDLRQLYVTPDNLWIDRLRSEIVSSSARGNHLQVTLTPEHLGRLDIMLTTQDGKVDIRFDASTSAVIQILATQQAQLIDDLRQAGVKVGQFELTNSPNGARQQQQHRHDAQTSDPQPTQNRNTLSYKKRGRFA